MLRYFASLSLSKTILWCYLLWYLVTVYYHFDATPAIWLNSLGITVVIGLALMLSVGGRAPGAAGRWQSFRLFLLPFCVSSFSSLIKNKGFILIVPPARNEQMVSVAVCAAFVLLIVALKRSVATRAMNSLGQPATK